AASLCQLTPRTFKTWTSKPRTFQHHRCPPTYPSLTLFQVGLAHAALMKQHKLSTMASRWVSRRFLSSAAIQPFIATALFPGTLPQRFLLGLRALALWPRPFRK